MSKNSNHAPLRYNRAGARTLALQPINVLPSRNDVHVYGKSFPGDQPLIRKLAGRAHGAANFRADDLQLSIQRNSAFRGSENYNSIFSFDAERIYLTHHAERGTQHFEVSCPALREQIAAVMALNDDAAHAVLICIIQAQLGGAGYGYQHARRDYERAFADGRLRKKKLRGTDSYSIHIEPVPGSIEAMAAAA